MDYKIGDTLSDRSCFPEDYELPERPDQDPDYLKEVAEGHVWLCKKCGMTGDYDELMLEQGPELSFSKCCPKCGGPVERL
jgi:hypothetical protein